MKSYTVNITPVTNDRTIKMMIKIFINSNVALKGAIRCQVYNLPKQKALLFLPRRLESTSSISSPTHAYLGHGDSWMLVLNTL